ncbi:MAG: ATP-binding protein, partial [Solirubrobacteraceae bacterium]
MEAPMETVVGRTFSVDASAPTEARQFACEAASSCADEPTIADLGLLVSELVTNSVVHGRTASWVRVEVLLGEHIRTEVIDSGDGFSFRPRHAVEPRGGFGLYLVQRIAESWGLSVGAATRVWFSLPLHADRGSRSASASRLG